MRLERADPDLDGHVADVALRELRQRGDPLDRRLLPVHQRARLRLNLRRDRAAVRRQRRVPARHVVPGAVRFAGELRLRRDEVDGHPPGHGAARRPARLVLHRGQAGELPGHVVAVRLRLDRGGVEPALLVRPAVRQHDRVARRLHRHVALEVPSVLQRLRPLAALVLPGEDRPRLRHRDAQHLDLLVGVQLAVDRRDFHGVAVARRELLAARPDRPGVQRSDLRLAVERDPQHRELAPLGVDDPRGHAARLRDLSRVRNRDRRLVEQHDRVRIRRQLRQRCPGQLLEPVGRAAPRQRGRGHERGEGKGEQRTADHLAAFFRTTWS